MKSKFIINQASARQAVIEIFGDIGESWYTDTDNDIRHIADLLKEVEALSCDSIRVVINSMGGDINQALAIYDVLSRRRSALTVEIVGMCASAATVIAMAADRRQMSRHGMMLIHKCSSVAAGNENELQRELQTQQTVNSRLVDLYAERTAMQPSEVAALMEENDGRGRWLDYEECMQKGLCTEPTEETLAARVKGFAKRLCAHILDYASTIDTTTTDSVNDTTTDTTAVDAVTDTTTDSVNDTTAADGDTTNTAIDSKTDQTAADDEPSTQIDTPTDTVTDTVTDTPTDTVAAEIASLRALVDEQSAQIAALRAQLDKQTATLAALPQTAPLALDDTAAAPSFAAAYAQQDYVREAHARLGI